MLAKLWKPMLAAKPDPAELDAELTKLPFPALFSPKLDGIRATVQNGRLYSRTLKLIPNLEMQQLWGRKDLNGLDGEIIVGAPTAEDCFNRTTSAVMSKDKSAEGAVFYVFDQYHPTNSFYIRNSDASDTTKASDANSQTLRLVKHQFCKTLKEVQAYEAKQLKLGHEGIMRRDPNGAYKQGRSTMKEGGLVAIKRFVDAEAVILDTYEQEENTNEKTLNELGKMKRSSHKAGKVGKGTLGGFAVQEAKFDRQYGKEGFIRVGTSFNIGTGQGLTDAVRKGLWEKRGTLPGQIIKFRYQLIGTKDAPRLPIFLGFRDKTDL